MTSRDAASASPEPDRAKRLLKRLATQRVHLACERAHLEKSLRTARAEVEKRGDAPGLLASAARARLRGLERELAAVASTIGSIDARIQTSCPPPPVHLSARGSRPEITRITEVLPLGEDDEP